ncbi:zinc-binding alcohol dehydrogenase family protein [Saccharibacillus sacchari]|uniref:Zinc-binding alcohol dehydrogenase family protein n=1 Tax=Saccharibacillus sacchari TaxID=456493 RepID=A0ACC6PES1_9BACL
MNAAVVRSFGSAPKYESFEAPQPSDDHEMQVEVLASALHLRVRGQADGSHYTSTGELPLIPGVDGVCRLPDGRTAYFVSPDTAYGAMAEQTVIDLRRCVPLPEGIDPVQIAAAMNPAMSAWVALRRRIDFPPGGQVLVLGATGSSGQMAVRIAKLFGASRVIGAGRNPKRLQELLGMGADEVVSLSGDPGEVSARLAEAASEVDIVIDYLWGHVAELAMLPLLKRRSDRSRALHWIEIGSMAGASASIPSAALRSANFHLIGSGQGSVTAAGYLAEFPALIEAITSGKLSLNTRTVPLSEVEAVWQEPADAARRVVFVP